MVTDFYLITKNKVARDKYFRYEYNTTDEPAWGYAIHIARTSDGWLPLFNGWDCFKSIRELKSVYDTGLFTIYDEYGTSYNWEEFDKRVLQFNGGVKGAIAQEKVEQDKNYPYYNSNIMINRPISHFDYASGRYAYRYYTDEDGYEFARSEFGM